MARVTHGAHRWSSDPAAPQGYTEKPYWQSPARALPVAVCRVISHHPGAGCSPVYRGGIGLAQSHLMRKESGGQTLTRVGVSSCGRGPGFRVPALPCGCHVVLGKFLSLFVPQFPLVGSCCNYCWGSLCLGCSGMSARTSQCRFTPGSLCWVELCPLS